MAAAAVVILLSGCSLGRPPEDATGEEIYAQLCGRCHGSELDGGVAPGIGPGSSSADETDVYLEFSIMNGRGRMPSFSSSIDDDQLDRLIAYIREVQQG